MSVNAKDGEIRQASGSTLSAGGESSFTAGDAGSPAGVTLDSTANNLSGAINASGNDVSLTNSSTGGTHLKDIVTSGNLNVDSRYGAITQVIGGEIKAGAITNLKAMNGNVEADITLDNPANDFVGAVNASGTDVSIADTSGLTANLTATGDATLVAGGNLVVDGTTNNLATTTTNGGTTSFGVTTVTGNLVTTSAGTVTQSGGLTVVGTTDMNVAGQDITLALADRNSIELGNITTSGSLNITAQNDINQTTGSAIMVAGNSTLTATTGYVTLASTGNRFDGGLSVYDRNTGTGTPSNPFDPGTYIPRTPPVPPAPYVETTTAITPPVVVAGSGEKGGIEISTSSPNDGALTASTAIAVTTDTSETGVANAPTDIGNNLTTSLDNITVRLLSPPTSQAAGIIVVSVPGKLIRPGTLFSFPLPEQIKNVAAVSTVAERVSMPDGGPLPSWLEYHRDNKTFVASDVPVGALPLTVMIAIGDQSWSVEITKQEEK